MLPLLPWGSSLELDVSYEVVTEHVKSATSVSQCGQPASEQQKSPPNISFYIVPSPLGHCSQYTCLCHTVGHTGSGVTEPQNHTESQNVRG